MKKESFPQPDSRVRTELLLGSNGSIYINVGDVPPERLADRAIFVGYALKPQEVARRGREGLLSWAASALVAIGSDGRIYVAEAELSEPSKPKRRVFRGFEANAEEKARIVGDLHRMAFNLTVGLGPREGEGEARSKS